MVSPRRLRGQSDLTVSRVDATTPDGPPSELPDGRIRAGQARFWRLRQSPDLTPVTGPVPSTATVWRALAEIGLLQLTRLNAAVTAFRKHWWGLLAAGPNGFPCLTTTGRRRSSTEFGTSSLTPIGIYRVSGGRRAISKAAQEHWRYVNGAHLVALVRAGVKFEKGVLVERPEQAAQEVAA